MIAQITSWAIFGPAVQWSHAPITRSLEAMTDDILLVITEGVLRVVPTSAP
ncbi:MAG: hypothetical protein NT075_26755 [Chloroflexi bacterium]|nr:hypothetical protein [Chloroflexota bacterium]